MAKATPRTAIVAKYLLLNRKDETTAALPKALIATKDSADLHTKLREFRVYEYYLPLATSVHHRANHSNQILCFNMAYENNDGNDENKSGKASASTEQNQNSGDDTHMTDISDEEPPSSPTLNLKQFYDSS
ncbi:uncharacterized protein TrAtP1_008549 [Trichoderma atroviride]|uniref:uncharacterized protein n=1 Tax=Hypocrea atroviridis TaxID=63577 RepID=UPI00332F6C2C|nr:hypothetical protein TrAtP1_008549 [Trichoderma atroviride]